MRNITAYLLHMYHRTSVLFQTQKFEQ